MRGDGRAEKAGHLDDEVDSDKKELQQWSNVPVL
jgi:hypothetical protein